jgi:hypothetical protein
MIVHAASFRRRFRLASGVCASQLRNRVIDFIAFDRQSRQILSLDDSLHSNYGRKLSKFPLTAAALSGY